MDIEKLLLAILLSLIILLGITLSTLIVVGVFSLLSMGQYSSLIGLILVLILFVCLVFYFYKNVE